MFKKILVNILLIVLLVSSLEVFCYIKEKEFNLARKQYADKLESNNTRNFITKYRLLSDFKALPARKSFFVKNSNKKPILWFGCSFAEGAGLTDLQTPCYKISQLTGRSCINKSKGATGTQFIYYQLKNDDFFTTTPSVEYIVYTFLYNHIYRLYNYQVNPLIDMFNLRYKLENGELKEIHPTFRLIHSSFIIKRFLNNLAQHKAKNEEIDFTLFNEIMKASKQITSSKYPNSKFIILEFPDLSGKELPYYEIQKLKDMGIQVVKVKDIFQSKIKDKNGIYDSKYWLNDNIHPSALLWDVVLPEIVKQYIK